MKLSEIKTNPNNPRLIKDDKFKKLCQSIKDFPKMMELRPIIIDDDNVILGGNMRFRACKENGMKEIPDEWVKKASELTEEQKKEFVIKDNSNFGNWDFDDLANNWDVEDLNKWGLEFPDWDVEAEKVGDDTYTKEIKAPTYEPKNEKPKAKELFDEEKAKDLIKEIMESDISKEDKEFLIVSAKRHTVFNYSKIADYYANSDKKVQDLMEKSALVIIDFNKAIENGYVQLTKEISELYGQEYGEENEK